jgi:Fur family transcriptional regulator, ferric uptake regulator
VGRGNPRLDASVSTTVDLHLQQDATLGNVTASRQTDVIELLRQRGLRMTPQRRAIVAEIMRTQGHISPTELARTVQGEMPGVNPSTIYRTLALLEEVGVLAHAHLESGAEYHRAEEAGHVHLTCSNCGAEDDLSMEEAGALVRLIERHHGFHPDLTHFAISGLCEDCAAEIAAG